MNDDINKILSSPDKLTVEIAMDSKSKTTVIRLLSHEEKLATDVIIPANGYVSTASFAINKN